MLEQEGGSVTLLHRPGLSLDVLLELQRYLGVSFDLHEVPAEEFQQRLTKVYQSGEGAALRAAEDLGAEFDLSSMAEDLADRTDLLAGDDDAPIIRLINAILSQAVREQASDIHLEPFEDRVSVRFRIDGVLSEILSPKAELAPVLVSRLKVMRSEEHTSELQSRGHLVCRLLLEKKNRRSTKVRPLSRAGTTIRNRYLRCVERMKKCGKTTTLVRR